MFYYNYDLIISSPDIRCRNLRKQEFGCSLVVYCSDNKLIMFNLVAGGFYCVLRGSGNDISRHQVL